MYDFLKNAGGFFKDNSDALSGIGAIVGGVGGAYGAYSQAKALDRNYQLNYDLLKEERKRRKKADESLAGAYNNSSFSKGV